MAWRPTQYLFEGELDNTIAGKVTGWMRFAGVRGKVTFDLVGDFHRDIRGATIRFRGEGKGDDAEAASYMDGFAAHQTGKVGDMTAGLPPHDYGDGPYLEWFGQQNGRVVIELSQEQITVIGTLRPWTGMVPISREEQAQNMTEFLTELSQELNAPAIAVGPDGVTAVSPSARNRAPQSNPDT